MPSKVFGAACPSYQGCTGFAGPQSFFTSSPGTTVSKQDKAARQNLIDHLNEDLAREYQAIIAYVIYSKAIKGPQYMHIAKELEVHAGEELKHALTIAEQIDYLGGEITATPK